MIVRTRFAPSPTGFLHLGGARTALFSWLYARRHGGEFMLRIEDTDRARSSDEAMQTIKEGMAWLGLHYDGELCRSSGMGEHHEAALRKLLETEQAYYCYCSPEELTAMREAARARGEKPRYDGRCRKRKGEVPSPDSGVQPVVRLRTPDEGMICVPDLVQGEVRFNNAELDDLVLARADGAPTYHLTVVVDDHQMGITHVIRGDDHLNNTPRQIHILQALEYEQPCYAHIPMLLDEKGRKLSKRTGAPSVLKYREQGYLPEAMLNYLVRLGWSHGDEEYFERQQMIEKFELDAVQRSPARIDPDKLSWLNGHYMKGADDGELARALRPFFDKAGVDVQSGPALEELVGIQKKRTNNLLEVYEQSLCFYSNFNLKSKVDSSAVSDAGILSALRDIREALAALGEWNAPSLMQCIEDCATRHELKFGKLAKALRVVVTGGNVSPGIGNTLYLAGREHTLACIDQVAKAA